MPRARLRPAAFQRIPPATLCLPSSGTPTTFVDAPAWTFTAGAGGAVLIGTDAFLSTDQFELLDSACRWVHVGSWRPG